MSKEGSLGKRSHWNEKLSVKLEMESLNTSLAWLRPALVQIVCEEFRPQQLLRFVVIEKNSNFLPHFPFDNVFRTSHTALFRAPPAPLLGTPNPLPPPTL